VWASQHRSENGTLREGGENEKQGMNLRLRVRQPQSEAETRAQHSEDCRDWPPGNETDRNEQLRRKKAD
jgi:hypothetical protein